MKIIQQIFIKRWKPILEEYEKIQNKVLPRPFRFVKDLCHTHHISNKEIGRYYFIDITMEFPLVLPMKFIMALDK